MSTEICIKNITILKTSAGVFEELYYKLEEIINNMEINLNSEINSLMSAMKINIEHSSYFWLDDFITTSENVHTLLNILEQAIKILQKDLPDFTINALWGFYKELMIYGYELRAQGK